jgi:hypothetical protein
MPSEYNCNPWTERTNLPRVIHFAGEKHSKWSESRWFCEWRKTPWDEVMRMHERNARTNG